MTFTVGMSFSTSAASSTRSSSVKSGAFRGLAAIATTTGSNSLTARRSRSSWPLVIGSKVPGYIAPTFMMSRPVNRSRAHCTRGRPSRRGADRARGRSLGFAQQPELDPAGLRTFPPFAALRRLGQATGQRTLDVDDGARREARIERGENRLDRIAIRRIDERDVERSGRAREEAKEVVAHDVCSRAEHLDVAREHAREHGVALDEP